MKKPVIFILIAMIVCSVMYITFKKDFDQFNPLYKEEYAFSVVNTSGKQRFQIEEVLATDII